MWWVYTREGRFWQKEEGFEVYAEALIFCHTYLHRRKTLAISRENVWRTKTLKRRGSFNPWETIPTFVSGRRKLKRQLEQIKLDRDNLAVKLKDEKRKLGLMNGLEEGARII